MIIIALSVHLLALWKQESFLGFFTFAILCLLGGWLTGGGESPEGAPLRSRRYEVEEGSREPVVARSLETAKLPLNAFTIDLEDYFHTEVASRTVDHTRWEEMPARIESSVNRLLDVLDTTGTKSTVFTLGWVAKRYPALIREVSRRGHEVACHSHQHQPVFRLTPDQFWEDTRRAKLTIEDAIGARVVGYRAPNFSITPGTEWAFHILAEQGFEYDSSVHPVWHKLYANPNAPRFPYLIPGTPLVEIPISTVRIAGRNLPVAGGAYLRLLPFVYSYHGLKHLIERERQPVTLYMHPWEIDYLQPVVNADWKSRIRQTWGTHTFEHKLTRLLSEWEFASIPEAYAGQMSRLAKGYEREQQHKPQLLQVG